MILTDTMREAATKRIGQNIKELRTARGWTQARFQRETGIPRVTLTKWERGCNPPPSNVMPYIAHALGVTLDRLFEGA